jgi:DnaJ-class molecular chaperone
MSIHHPIFHLLPDNMYESCHHCNGEGIIQDDTDVINSDSYHICGECNGKGVVEMDAEKAHDLRWSNKNEPNNL